ncbi:unnamed protein product [Protopolystoma xenopodis]|uniref:Uncharacterized protein n=1 Tax=Protopolystoma xenopodis TaxID=117903 RepID=A0A448WCJ7_9PLAT|nr:unnamed protein product [Protopolystoma xenopodis]
MGSGDLFFLLETNDDRQSLTRGLRPHCIREMDKQLPPSSSRELGRRLALALRNETPSPSDSFAPSLQPSRPCRHATIHLSVLFGLPTSPRLALGKY